VKLALFDLSGTLLRYASDRPVPLMMDLLLALGGQEWIIGVVSRFSESHCKALLAKAGLDAAVAVVLSSQSSTKGMQVADALRDGRYDECIFVDDNPENLESVLLACRPAVRVIGFVGSRRYTPELSQWCKHHDVELALAPVDLIEGLEAPVDAHAALKNWSAEWQEDEITALIPGLDHPMSAIAGSTVHFDHRRILAELLEHRQPENYADLWFNIAWISCNECLWKVLVRTVLGSLEIDAEDVLGAAYKHWEYTEALKAFAKANSSVALRSGFDRAVATMKQGIKTIGIDAEPCRLAGRPPMQVDRIELAEKRIEEALS
jgi:hypothetical protein